MHLLDTDSLTHLLAGQLIASIALAHRATLVTHNIRHFRPIPGLTVENWID